MYSISAADVDIQLSS